MAARALSVRVRSPGSGRARLIDVPLAEGQATVKGALLLELISLSGLECISTAREGARWRALYFDRPRRGWAALTHDAELPADEEVHVELEDASTSAHWTGHSARQAEHGFFGIGVVRGKTAENHGTIWRSAYQMGAAFTFTVGKRFTRQAADTTESWKEVPALHFEDFDAFASTAPFGAQWVAVEMGGTPLQTFVHPPRAVYLLGAEDGGLPASVCRAAHHRITIPSVRTASFNVAVAASIVMYDRLCKATPPPAIAAACNGRTPAACRAPGGAEAPPAAAAPPRAATAPLVAAAPAAPRVRKALAEWCGAGAHGQVLLLRCHRAFRQRVEEYCAARHSLQLEAAGAELLAFSAPAASAAAAWCDVRADLNLQRAVEGAFVVEHLAELEEMVAALASAVAAAPRCVVRLQSYPRELRATLERMLPPEVRLHPKEYTHVCFAVQPPAPLTRRCMYALVPADRLREARAAAGGGGGEQSVLAEAMRREALPAAAGAVVVVVQEAWKRRQPTAQLVASTWAEASWLAPEARAMVLDAPDLPRVDVCVVDLNVDAERISPLLTGWLARRLGHGGWCVAVLQLGSNPAARDAKLARLREELGGAGYAAEDSRVHWLFANGPCERTLVLRRTGTSSEGLG
ncbi:hypothetical protein AB1Y20_022478 [Prymnesium parvum]|uniref:tRNA/rRNA methyltransferase SpoU type domain-containing protein n=1 Tax=Prymnesium parvum TaxID=97485 RepID=A0AB34JIX9_PRYPA